MNILDFTVLADAGVWYAYHNSDGMGKAIIVLLFLGSMYVWYVMIEKTLTLYRSLKLSERFASEFNNSHGMKSMLRTGVDNPCPVARVYVSGMEQMLEFYGQTTEEARSAVPSRNDGSHKLSQAQLDAVQTAMEREISSQIFVIEERIGSLATVVSLAPFCGLFGTVWGVMIAFCGVASAGSANIQALAPGVAGALLTTVAGLVVAIPSLVGYNCLTQMIRKITVSMDNFSESFMARLKLEQLVAQNSSKAAAASTAGSTQTAIQSRPTNSTAYQSHYSQSTQAATPSASTDLYSRQTASEYSFKSSVTGSSTNTADGNSQMDLGFSGNDPDDSMRG